MAGGNTLLTPNVHYLPTSSTDFKHGRKRVVGQEAQPVKPVSLPGLAFLMEESSICTTKAMYIGNATLGTPQKSHTRMQFRELSAKTLEVDSADVRKVSLTRPEQFLHSPALEITKRWRAEVAAVGESDDNSDDTRETFHQQLEAKEVSSTVSVGQLSSVACVVGSWWGEPLSLSDQPQLGRGQSAHRQCPASNSIVHLHMQSRDTVLTRAWLHDHTSVSASVGSCSSAVIVEEGSGRRLCCMVPVFHGPLDTRSWSTVEAYRRPPPRSPQPSTREKLVEFSTSAPLEGSSGCLA